jgi:hypothetical protein
MARWQVELCSQWQDFKEKPERTLREAFQCFIAARLNAKDDNQEENLQERFINIAVNGRKMRVDFLTMTMLRLDNKKQYKVSPPQFVVGESCKLFCRDCQRVYAVGRFSDCRWCDSCYQAKNSSTAPTAPLVVPACAASDELQDKTVASSPFTEPVKVAPRLWSPPHEPLKVTLGSLSVRYEDLSNPEENCSFIEPAQVTRSVDLTTIPPPPGLSKQTTSINVALSPSSPLTPLKCFGDKVGSYIVRDSSFLFMQGLV